MTYAIAGLPAEPFVPLFALSDAELAARGARRVVARAGGGYPCRVSLEEAAEGEALLLLNYTSHEDGPYRTTHAIFVRESAAHAEPFVGSTPPVFAGRILSLRGFSAEGEIVAASLAAPEDHEQAIHALFEDPRIDHIDAHNAARGCFSARIERYRSEA